MPGPLFIDMNENQTSVIHPLKRKFKLGTTSFIVPDDIVPNVKKLAPYFDEIELLVFESLPDDVLPTPAVVDRLAELAKEHDLTYNIHLPVDISLTRENAADRRLACKQIVKVMALFSRLTPSTYTLHLEMPVHLARALGKHGEPSSQESGIRQEISTWCDTVRTGLKSLMSHGIDPGLISVETLDYSFSIVSPLVEAFGLSVCIDAGHQIKYGYDLAHTFDCHKSRTPLIHLHGVDFSGTPVKDHTALDRLSVGQQKIIYEMLSSFNGTVSIEVFNLATLNRSLAVLSTWFKGIPYPLNI